MPIERFANFLRTTINNSGGISSGDTSLTVTDGSIFPSSGNFRILIESELILVTARSSNVFTIERGIEGTAAAAHADGEDVLGVLSIEGLLGAIKGRTPDYRTPLVLTEFAWANQGTASAVEVDGVLSMLAPITIPAQNRQLLKALPAAPYKVTLQMWFMAFGASVTAPCGGLVLTDGTKLVTLALLMANVIELQKWDDAQTFNSNYVSSSTDWRVWGKPIYLQIEDDNTNRIYRMGPDGLNYKTMHTVGRTDFLTPTHYGICINSEGLGELANTDRLLPQG